MDSDHPDMPESQRRELSIRGRRTKEVSSRSSPSSPPSPPSQSGDPSSASETSHSQVTTKKRTLRRDDWEIHRGTIERLYIVEDKKLGEIVEIMEQEYDFSANARMYKHRLNQWGLVKYNRETDVQAILQLKRRRDAEGKDSRIEINGRVVDFDKVEKYLRRRKLSANPITEDLEGDEAAAEAGPSNHPERAVSIVARTPPPPPPPRVSPRIRSPDIYHDAEGVLWSTRAYAAVVHEGQNELSREAFSFLDSVLMIHELMEQQRPSQAGEFMQLASSQVAELIRLQPEETALTIFESVLVLTSLAPEVARMLLRHAADIAAVYIEAADHPMRHLLKHLAESTGGPQQLLHTAKTAYQCHLHTWEGILGRHNSGFVYWWTRYLRAVGPDETRHIFVTIVETVVRNNIEAFELTGSTEHMQGAAAMEKLQVMAAYEFANARSSAPAWRRTENLVDRQIEHATAAGAFYAKAFMEYAMARVSLASGRAEEADAYLQACVDTYTSIGKDELAVMVKGLLPSVAQLNAI